MGRQRPIEGMNAATKSPQRDPFQKRPPTAPAKLARRKLKIVFFAMLVGSVFGCLAVNPAPFLFFNVSKSAPLGFWIRTIKQDPPGRGTFYALCLPDPIAKVALLKRYLIYIKKSSPCSGHVPMVLKRIAALPGDRIDLSKAGVRVNGTLVPGSMLRTTDSKGRRLSHMSYGSHTIPSGEIFLLGENLSVSWDSRYYGPVPARSLRFPVRPFLTWGR